MNGNETIEKILSMSKQGLSTNEIAEKLDIAKAKVGTIKGMFGLSSKGNRDIHGWRGTFHLPAKIKTKFNKFRFADYDERKGTATVEFQ